MQWLCRLASFAWPKHRTLSTQNSVGRFFEPRPSLNCAINPKAPGTTCTHKLTAFDTSMLRCIGSKGILSCARYAMSG